VSSPNDGSRQDPPRSTSLSQKDIDSFEALIDYLKRNRGLDFTGYKRQSLIRRVRRRMQVVNIASFSDYQSYLKDHPEEFVDLFSTILINVTSFFRDKEAWEFLSREVLPRILASKKDDDMVRIWSAGCASGEEVFTIAMLIIDAIGEEEFKRSVKVFATDIDEAALAQARTAVYASKDL
jgi:two-component system CheB/CheR fusion protein